jgi:epsilon-lactone hydrolase
LRIDVGSDEVLLDDSLQVAKHGKAANVSVEVTVWEGMWHVFQQYSYVSPEGQQSLDIMGKFILRQTKL